PFGGPAFCRKRRIGEGEDKRQHHGDQHAQRGARGVFRQIARIERGWLPLQFGQGLEKIPACFAEKNQKAKDQKNGENIPSTEQTGPAANRNWDEYAHALGQLSETAVTKPQSRNRGSQNCRESRTRRV